MMEPFEIFFEREKVKIFFREQIPHLIIDIILCELNWRENEYVEGRVIVLFSDFEINFELSA